MAAEKKLIFPEVINLKTNSEYSERWVKDTIIENPTILGLGDVSVKDSERSLPKAGRVDLLLHDLENKRRFEVELQLGKTDESHIIRTIEYWDIERKRYPQYDHCAVIIAEEITSRFFNVISLFNGHIPLIALQMNCYEVNGQVMLTFTRVLDEVKRGLEEEDVTEITDRTYWLERGTPVTIKIIDKLHSFVKEFAPRHDMKYNKFYIGLSENGSPDNFVIFRAFKNFARIEIRLPKTKDYDSQCEKVGFDDIDYDTRWGKYKIDIRESDMKDDAKISLVKKLMEESFSNR